MLALCLNQVEMAIFTLLMLRLSKLLVQSVVFTYYKDVK